MEDDSAETESSPAGSSHNLNNEVIGIEVSGEQPPKPARKPRKKKSKAKSFINPKKRGLYQPKVTSVAEDAADEQPPIGIGDPDLADCLCSDDEARSEFLKDVSKQLPLHKDVEERNESPVGFCSQETIGDIELASTTNLTEPSSTHMERLDEGLFSPQSSSSTSTHFAQLSIGTSLSEDPSATSLQELASSSARSQTEPSDLQSDSTGVEDNAPLPMSTAPPHLPPRAIIDSSLERFRSELPSNWFPIADSTGIHMLQLSSRSPKAIQKEIYMSYEGEETISVHLVLLKMSSDILESVSPTCLKLKEDTVHIFCERGLNIVKRLNLYGVCVGANDDVRKDLWGTVPGCFVDSNIFKEDSYQTTCRAESCDRLFLKGKGRKRCLHCAKLMKNLLRRGTHSVSASSNLNNRYLTNEEAMKKIFLQRDEIRKKDKKIAYLTKRLQSLLDDEGVEIEPELSADLSDILSRSNLTTVQQIFLEEQLKQSNRADARGHKWHPTMIRLALFLYMKSRSAYEALRSSGAVKLPCSRTLYDYSHAYDATPGVNEGLLKSVSEEVRKLKPHQQFVSLIADEMHVSRNLVYRQSDGVLIGYTHLDELEKEMSCFEACINGEGAAATAKIHLANTVLAFMVKGILSSVKAVIAAYPCNTLTKDMLYARTWNIISRLEIVGVKVLSMTCDGCAVNRAFIGMHVPITVTESGVIFDTFNFCSKDERPLFFISDVAHLIKTIRNCFHNSGEGKNKPRCLEVNGEKIVWTTIIRLYLQYKQCTLRKTYKLNSQNVFPNSYSCMKVKLAAEVLSDTVALHIEQQNWPNTSSTVTFIRMCNKFFDCLNGAHSSQHIRTRNENLKPYCDETDPRYFWIQNTFLKYIEDWRAQARSLQISPKEQEKKMLSYQTQNGIEMAIKGFTAATKYLVKEANKQNEKIFIMARAFSQDPLENYFSRQRGAVGGSSNPNVAQFLSHQVTLGIQKDLGIALKRSNAPETDESNLQNEPLPKRRAPRKKHTSKPPA